MWQHTDIGLYRRFTFKDFKQAFAFMTEVGAAAEAAGHHPRWLNEYNEVEIWLSTHEAGGLATGKDHQLASVISKLADTFAGGQAAKA